MMFVFEGRPNMNIAIITITGLMATNKKFAGKREKMKNLQGKEKR